MDNASEMIDADSRAREIVWIIFAGIHLIAPVCLVDQVV